MPRNDLIRLRDGSEAEWDAADPVLAEGEPGYDRTTATLKVGDGTTAWSALSAVGASGSTDAEIVRDTVAAFAVAGTDMTIAHDDGANTLTFTVSGPSFNVKKYGAVGNGSTSDTTAVQAAIDAAAVAGGEVVFPPGTYLVGTLTLKSNVWLRGSGAGSTTLKLANSTNADLLVTDGFSGLTGGTTQAGPSNFRLSNLTLDGNRANNTSGWPLRIYGSTYTVDNVHIKNGKSGGVWTQWGSGGTNMEAHWSNFKIYNCEGVLLDHNGPHDSLFVNGTVFNDSTQPAETGTLIYARGQSSGSQFTNIHAWGNCDRGIDVINTTFFTNCQAEGATTANVRFQSNYSQWTGGHIFGTSSGTEIGIEFGVPSVTSAKGIRVTNVMLSKFASGSFPISWAASGGSNVVEGQIGFPTTATTLTTGTPVTTAGIEDRVDIRSADPTSLASSWATPTTRTISTTAPLTGGGDLSANRTLAVSAATTSASGVAELATLAETDAHSDAGRVVTPSGLANHYVAGGTDVAIADGGTGASTAAAGFDALAPTTTNGDLIVRAGGTNARLAVGSDGQVLKVISGAPAWGTDNTGGGGLSDGDYGDITVSGGASAFTIDAGAVTYAKMQDVSASDRILGRVSASAGDVEEIVFTDQAQQLCDDTSFGAMLTTLGAQPLDSDLTDLATRWTAASASTAASLDFHEDTDNGTNRARLIGPTSTADVTITLPSTTGTVALTADITTHESDTTSVHGIADTTALYAAGGTDVAVADGGTGRSTSTTAYGIIAAGTTATGAHQTISPGTSGHFLKSAGASALASFAAIAQSDVSNLTTDLAAKTDESGGFIENCSHIEYDVNVVAASGSTETLDTSLFSVHDVTMDAGCTFTFSNPAPSGEATVFMLILRGAFTPVFPASVDWPDGTPPTYTTPSIYTFVTRDAGTTWLGFSQGKAFA